MEQVEGIIQRIKNDRKALSLLGTWYNSFKPMDESIKVGDNVKIIYGLKGDFKNIKSIEQIKQDIPEEIEGSVKPKYISDSTINCLIMQSVQLSKDEGIGLDIATDKILENYKKIIDNI